MEWHSCEIRPADTGWFAGRRWIQYNNRWQYAELYWNDGIWYEVHEGYGLKIDPTKWQWLM